MQFKITTDYAIRTVLYLATKNEVTTSGEISQIMGIPQKYLIKLLGELSNIIGKSPYGSKGRLYFK